MKNRTVFVILILILHLIGCTDFKEKKSESQNATRIMDTLSAQDAVAIQEEEHMGVFDSLARAIVDTTTLEGKREKIRNNFTAETFTRPIYDTLIDLTYDGHTDYVIGYYGLSGTGMKNRVNVYLFNPKLNAYIFNSKLSDLSNPTFYIKEKKITGFYIGNGGGGGEKMEWMKNNWVTTKIFKVDFDPENREKTEWIIEYPLTKKKEVLIRPFQMIPPKEILETEIDWDSF